MFQPHNFIRIAPDHADVIMKTPLAADDVARLARSAERFVRLAQEISRRSQQPALPEPEPPTADLLDPRQPLDDKVAAAAQQLIADYRARPDFGVPDCFCDRGWLLLLELLVAQSRAIDISVKTACLTIGGAQTTALRSILQLEKRGILRSTTDEKDGRRRLLSLSPSAEATLRRYVGSRVDGQFQQMRMSLRMTTRAVDEEGKGTAQTDRPHRNGSIAAQSDSEVETVLQ